MMHLPPSILATPIAKSGETPNRDRCFSRIDYVEHWSTPNGHSPNCSYWGTQRMVSVWST